MFSQNRAWGALNIISLIRTPRRLFIFSVAAFLQSLLRRIMLTAFTRPTAGV